MIDDLKRAVDRVAQQPEQEQAYIAQLIIELLESDAKWAALFADPRTPKALEALWAEAQQELKAGRTEEIKGDGFLTLDRTA